MLHPGRIFEGFILSNAKFISFALKNYGKIAKMQAYNETQMISKLLSLLLTIDALDNSYLLNHKITICGSTNKLSALLLELLNNITVKEAVYFGEKNKTLNLGFFSDDADYDNCDHNEGGELEEPEKVTYEKALKLREHKMAGNDAFHYIRLSKTDALKVTLTGVSFNRVLLSERNCQFCVQGFLKDNAHDFTKRPGVLIKVKHKKLSIIPISSKITSFLGKEQCFKGSDASCNTLGSLDTLSSLSDFSNIANIIKTPNYDDFTQSITRFKQTKIPKVVLARSITIPLEKEINAFKVTNELLIKFLRTKNFTNYFFAFLKVPSHDALGEAFISYTPETLFKTQGNTIFSEALAGSLPVTHGHLLLSDKKNLLENNIVLQSILEDLGPLSKKLTYNPPKLIHLPYIAHLISKIRGTLENNITCLEILNALHPTPATLGYPKDEALAFLKGDIGKHCVFTDTPLNLNYYAGAAGFSEEQKGLKQKVKNCSKFIVLLRSANICNKFIRAYGGAGIMPDSDILVEWHETKEKLTPILSSLYPQKLVREIKDTAGSF